MYESSYFKVSESEKMLDLGEIGFKKSQTDFPSLDLSTKMLKGYEKNRDVPSLDNGTSKLGLHLRFGTVSVRELAREGLKYSDVWLSELIWRNSENDFSKWTQGMTGYHLVDAGMRELNATGYMHNRVRMLVASFLCKHLLIYWHQGERYFAKKLLDYDLSANVGNWQWAAGSGCDAAPYFRIFNPMTQQEKFDPDFEYIKKWIPEYRTAKYPDPIIDHAEARGRCLHEFNHILKKEKT